VSLTSNLVRDDALSVTDVGVELALRLPWFRSLPVSCVGNLALTIDGRTALPDQVRIRIGDRELEVGELADRHEFEWFVLDELTVALPMDSPPERGSVVSVTLDLDVRIPDILIGPETALTYHHHVERDLIAL